MCAQSAFTSMLYDEFFMSIACLNCPALNTRKRDAERAARAEMAAGLVGCLVFSGKDRFHTPWTGPGSSRARSSFGLSSATSVKSAQ